MTLQTRLFACLLASGLAFGCSSGRQAGSGSGNPLFSPERVYVVETRDGDVFSTRIADFDSDSLYFQDGTTLARIQVGSVREKGKTAEGETIESVTQSRRR